MIGVLVPVAVAITVEVEVAELVSVGDSVVAARWHAPRDTPIMIKRTRARASE